MEQDDKTILLLVDDQELVLKSVSRILHGHFSQILTAKTSEQAEELLKQYAVTHVVCDYNLGDDQPRGTTLLTAWRAQYPDIRRALILTSTEPETLPPCPLGVDEILDKLCPMRKLLESLGVAQAVTS